MTSRSDPSSTAPDEAVARIHREEWGRLLSLLVARTRRLDLAEDALGEAFARAAAQWRRDGVPASPAAWLYTTAHRHVVGQVRREVVAGRKAPLLVLRGEWAPAAADPDDLPDERLHLVLLCCHPALPEASRSALALRLVIGTTSEQIARLFLVPPATMAARLTRAKRKIMLAGIPLGAPVGVELRARLDGVCRTIYLAFTAGYAPATGDDLLRADLAGDAVELAAVLHRVTPDSPQVRALYALVLLQHARRDARVGTDGGLVPLADQDRTRWRHDEIGVALRLLDDMAPADGYAEELRLQALIAAEHARVPTAAGTDWTAIAARYAELEALSRSAIVRLNRAVAVAEAQDPRAGLALLVGLDDLLGDDHRLHAVRGELAFRAGRFRVAEASFRAAVDRCGNTVERAHLGTRLAAVVQSAAEAGRAHGERT